MLSEVPEGWSCCHLGEAVQIDWGDTSVTKKAFTQTGFTAYSAAGGDGYLPYFDFEGTGVVVSAIGANSGRVFLADGKWSAIKNTMVVFPKEEISNIEFFYYLAQQPEFWAISGGAQPFIGLKNAKKQRIQLPPLNEQHRIAEILSSVDVSIQTTQAVIEQAERVKRGLMEELLTGGLGSEAIERGEVPDGWATLSLQSIADFITKGATPTTYGYGWESTGIPFFRSECVSERGFTRSGMAFISSEAHEALSRSVVKAGDLLISITGNVGRVAVVPESLQEGNINQHIARVRINSSEAEKKFIYYALSSPAQRRLFESIVTGQAYPQLSLKQIRETQMVVPPLCEQRRVIQILSSIDEFIAGQERIIGQQGRAKRGLMDDLLTGKVRTV